MNRHYRRGEWHRTNEARAAAAKSNHSGDSYRRVRSPNKRRVYIGRFPVYRVGGKNYLDNRLPVESPKDHWGTPVGWKSTLVVDGVAGWAL